VREGTVVFPFEPLIRVEGPLVQCQILETPLLNLINFSTLISTKASRVKLVAGNDEVIEFGLRRAQGPDGGLTASRASVIGGIDSTSNVLAGKIFDIPVRGTHSHSWVMSFPNEINSFEAYSKSMPDGCIFLVDTYSTIEGVKRAVEIGKKLRKEGHEFLGVRLDSGDLLKLSKKARKILDSAGFKNALIVGSGDLDEYEIERLKKSKGPINIWGVGTKLVTAFDQPALDGVYKLGAIKYKNGKWDFKMKLTDKDTKMTLPGIIQIRRFFSKKGFSRDILFNETNPPKEKDIPFFDIATKRKGVIPQKSKWIDLLIPVFQTGKCIYSNPPLKEIQNFAKNSLKKLSPGILKFKKPKRFPVGLHKDLHDLKMSLIRKLKINS
jgi:nicotinate phosphoribosyltransferase